MAEKKTGSKKAAKKQDTKTKKQDSSVLKNKITYLEEELVRKQEIIDKLKKENLVLFKTALKRSEEKVDKEKIE